MLRHLRLSADTLWLDVGAGGGFLAEAARESGQGGPAVGCDESAAFLTASAVYQIRAVAEYGRLPFADGGFGASGCLAALHHSEEPERVVGEMLRVTAPGGLVAVGDVRRGSAAAQFLNGFVDANTELGHSGRFFDVDGLAALLERAGGRGARGTSERVHWSFHRRDDARSFCRELFGLRPATTAAGLDQALDALGLAQWAGEWDLPWDMVFVAARA